MDAHFFQPDRIYPDCSLPSIINDVYMNYPAANFHNAPIIKPFGDCWYDVYYGYALISQKPISISKCNILTMYLCGYDEMYYATTVLFFIKNSSAIAVNNNTTLIAMAAAGSVSAAT